MVKIVGVQLVQEKTIESLISISQSPLCNAPPVIRIAFQLAVWAAAGSHGLIGTPLPAPRRAAGTAGGTLHNEL